MFDYLQKFNQLSPELRSRISSPAVMNAIDDLEKKYDLDLAIMIMKVMIGMINANELAMYFVSEEGLDQQRATQLQADLYALVFSDLRDYLKIKTTARVAEPAVSPAEIKQTAPTPLPQVTPKPISPPVELSENEKLSDILRASRIQFSSIFLQERFKSILRTHLRGVRNVVDTKLTLIKSVEKGGIGLDKIISDRVLELCGKHRTTFLPKTTKQSAIDRHIEKEEKKTYSSQEFSRIVSRRDVDYDLASVIADRLKKEKEEKLREDQNLALARTVIRPQQASDQVEKIIPKAERVREGSSEIPLDLEHELAPPTPGLIPVTVNLGETMDKGATPQKDDVIKFRLLDHQQNSAPSVQKKESSVIAPPVPLAINKPLQKNGKVSQKISDIVPEMINKMPPRVSSPAPRESGQLSKKTRIEDIKTAPKIMGPLEELRFMDLVNFRRLASTASARANKIEEKIDILEDDGYQKRVEGIHAWRKSPIYRLYLDIGQSAIMEKKQISAIINDRQKSNQDFLAMDEIESIVALNNKIRF